MAFQRAGESFIEDFIITPSHDRCEQELGPRVFRIELRDYRGVAEVRAVNASNSKLSIHKCERPEGILQGKETAIFAIPIIAHGLTVAELRIDLLADGVIPATCPLRTAAKTRHHQIRFGILDP